MAWCGDAAKAVSLPGMVRLRLLLKWAGRQCAMVHSRANLEKGLADDDRQALDSRLGYQSREGAPEPAMRAR